MHAKLHHRWAILIALLLTACLVWDAFAGSRRTDKTEGDSNNSAASDSNKLSGEEAWSRNCRHCHNLQPSTMYSDAQWEVIVHHMRVRANLTGEEHRAILEFLKSSH